MASALPSPLAPDLPTVASAGLPGFEAGSMWGFFGPARVPAALITRLHREIAMVLEKPDIREKLMNAFTEVVASSPEAFSALVKADMARGAEVIKAAGIKVE